MIEIVIIFLLLVIILLMFRPVRQLVGWGITAGIIYVAVTSFLGMQ